MNEFYILTYWDFILSPLYFLTIFIISNNIQKKREIKDNRYKYFTRGMLAKMIGAIALGMVYQFYYKLGGDTVNYFLTGKALANLCIENPGAYLTVINGGNIPENLSYFTPETGYPIYWNDDYSFFVSKIISPLIILSFNSYIVTSIFLACICFTGVWKLFLTFTNIFQNLSRQFAFSILFIPSVVFWGSGLLKDTITLSALGWYTYGFYSFFIKRKRKIKFALQIIIASYFLLSIKPYIFLAAIPGSLFWLSTLWSVKIKNGLVRTLFGPILIVLSIFLAYLTINSLSNSLGDYKLDKIIDNALIKQDDLKKEYYGGNNFDLGPIENTPVGILKVFPKAVIASLFRPFIWEVRNPMMLLSGIENLLILTFTIFLLIKLKIFHFFSLIRSQPILMFSFLFSVFFAYAIGVATPNFGALVRLRIPCMPFFISGLVILNYFHNLKKAGYDLEKIYKHTLS